MNTYTLCLPDTPGCALEHYVCVPATYSNFNKLFYHTALNFDDTVNYIAVINLTNEDRCVLTLSGYVVGALDLSQCSSKLQEVLTK